jgi:hypothetical protein
MRRYEGQVATASGLDTLAGIWLLISPFVVGFAYLTAAMTNNVVCGAVVIILALARFAGASRQVWMSWVNCLIGIWVLISPWVIGFARNHPATTNNVIIGIIIAILAFWSAVASTPTEGTVTRSDVDRL